MTAAKLASVYIRFFDVLRIGTVAERGPSALIAIICGSLICYCTSTPRRQRGTMGLTRTALDFWENLPPLQ